MVCCSQQNVLVTSNAFPLNSILSYDWVVKREVHQCWCLYVFNVPARWHLSAVGHVALVPMQLWTKNLLKMRCCFVGELEHFIWVYSECFAFFTQVVFHRFQIWAALHATKSIENASVIIGHVVHALPVLKRWLAAKGCWKFAVVFLNTQILGKQVTSITKAARKELPVNVLAVLLLNVLNNFPDVAVSASCLHMVGSELANKLQTSRANTNSMVSVLCALLEESLNVELSAIVVKARYQNHNRFVVN